MEHSKYMSCILSISLSKNIGYYFYWLLKKNPKWTWFFGPSNNWKKIVIGCILPVSELCPVMSNACPSHVQACPTCVQAKK